MPTALIRKYAAWCPPQSITLPECTKDAQTYLLNVLNDPHLTAYPPSSRYRRLFWKRMVEELEARADEEIDDRIFEVLISLIKSPSDGTTPGPPSETSYKTHYYPFSDIQGFKSLHGRFTAEQFVQPFGSVTIVESGWLIEDGTTGLRTWRAALAMGEWLLHNEHVVRERTVLELGCGTGFLSILISQMQLRSSGGEVWMSDVAPSVLNRCWQNVHLACNELDQHRGVNVLSLDWESSSSDLERELSRIHPSVILATDVVYDDSLISSLVTLLSLGLRTASEAWIATCVRNVDTAQTFRREADNAGIEIDDIDWSLNWDERIFLGGDEDREGNANLKLMKLTARA